jgi:broad specificity phosphatase PhoE
VSRRLLQDFPIKIPQRHDNRKDYACDPPLSEFGQLTGQIVGRELRLQGADIRRIFSSSALSCVQTAVAIIKGYRYVFASTV